MPSVHNSPNKSGYNVVAPQVGSKTVVNSVTVAALADGQAVSALGQATVIVEPATKFFVVDACTDRTYRYNEAGFPISSDALAAGTPRGRGNQQLGREHRHDDGYVMQMGAGRQGIWVRGALGLA